MNYDQMRTKRHRTASDKPVRRDTDDDPATHWPYTRRETWRVNRLLRSYE